MTALPQRARHTRGISWSDSQRQWLRVYVRQGTACLMKRKEYHLKEVSLTGMRQNILPATTPGNLGIPCCCTRNSLSNNKRGETFVSSFSSFCNFPDSILSRYLLNYLFSQLPSKLSSMASPSRLWQHLYYTQLHHCDYLSQLCIPSLGQYMPTAILTSNSISRVFIDLVILRKCYSAKL